MKVSPALTKGASNLISGKTMYLSVVFVLTLMLILPVSADFKFRFEGYILWLTMFQRWALLFKYDFTFNGVKDMQVMPVLRQIIAQLIHRTTDKATNSYRKLVFGVQIQSNLNFKTAVNPLSNFRKVTIPDATVSNAIAEQNFAVLVSDQSVKLNFVHRLRMGLIKQC